MKGSVLCALLCVAAAGKTVNSDADSPVQKVIELLQANKMKVQADVDAEAKEMAEYSEFCDTTSSDKGYAIKTADRKIADLTAAILNGEAQVAALNDEVSTLGTEMAEKERKLVAASGERKKDNADFTATEKELVTAVDQLDRAVVIIKREMSFAQQGQKHPGGHKDIKIALAAISKILDASWVSTGTKKALKGFMQTQAEAGDSDDLKLDQPQAKVSAYESHSGGIVEQIEDMKEKAEETLSGARSEEMKKQHNFDMMAQSLTDAITNCKEKLGNAKSSIAAMTEENGKATGELEETKKTKAADSEYLATLTQECTETAAAWADRQKSAAEEMAVIEKAKGILADRVKVIVQVKGKIAAAAKKGDDDDDDKQDAIMLKKVVNKLKDLSHQFSSYALMEMVSVASADPFEKVKGLIEQMIEKLVTEANEEATQKAFCDEETAKSKKAQEEKTMKLDKLKSRLDTAATKKAELESTVQDLEAEIAALDKSTSEATALRTAEKASNTAAAKDYKEAAEAVESAMAVLKEYYEGTSLAQTAHSSRDSSKQPTFGSKKSDAASSILSILEMCG